MNPCWTTVGSHFRLLLPLTDNVVIPGTGRLLMSTLDRFNELLQQARSLIWYRDGFLFLAQYLCKYCHRVSSSAKFEPMSLLITDLRPAVSCEGYTFISQHDLLWFVLKMAAGEWVILCIHWILRFLQVSLLSNRVSKVFVIFLILLRLFFKILSERIAVLLSWHYGLRKRSRSIGLKS